MGAFYVNYTIRSADQESVLRVLARHKAFVFQEQRGAVVVFEQQSDEQDEKVIVRLAAQLSKSLRTFILALLVHDSDILWYQLYRDGRLSDEYNSTPDYWSPKSEPSSPEGGEARRLCAAFGCSDLEKSRVYSAGAVSDLSRRDGPTLRLDQDAASSEYCDWVWLPRYRRRTPINRLFMRRRSS